MIAIWVTYIAWDNYEKEAFNSNHQDGSIRLKQSRSKLLVFFVSMIFMAGAAGHLFVLANDNMFPHIRQTPSPIEFHNR